MKHYSGDGLEKGIYYVTPKIDEVPVLLPISLLEQTLVSKLPNLRSHQQ